MLKTCSLILVFGLFGCVQSTTATKNAAELITVELLAGPTVTAEGPVKFTVAVKNGSETQFCMTDYADTRIIYAYRQSDMLLGVNSYGPGVRFEGDDSGTEPKVTLEPGETVVIPTSLLSSEAEIFVTKEGRFASQHNNGEKLVALAKVGVFPCSYQDYRRASYAAKVFWIDSAYSKPFAF